MRSANTLFLLGTLGVVAACSQAGAVDKDDDGDNVDSVASEFRGRTRDLLGVSDPGRSFRNPHGRSQTITLSGGPIDTSNAFFQPLGTNGRACVHCHAPSNGFSVSPRTIQQRFYATCNGGGHDDDRLGDGNEEPTCGDDPIFRPSDGANSPTADVSTNRKRREAYSILLDRGLIRIELPVPAAAANPATGYEIIDVIDPNGVATRENGKLSFYRRPIPTTNLKFAGAFEPARTNAPAIMWDGRDTERGCVSGPSPQGGKACSTSADCTVGDAGQTCVGATPTVAGTCRVLPQCGNPAPRVISVQLRQQANNAHLDHAGTTVPLTADEQTSIVNFERELLSGQVKGRDVGLLDEEGARGGPATLVTALFYNGINRAPPIGPAPGVPGAFNPADDKAFTIYTAWAASTEVSRQAVARGQELFNKRGGVSPVFGVRPPGSRDFTCTFCHNTPEVGSNSAGTWGNGIADSIGRWHAREQFADLPVYVVRSRATGKVVRTHDLGRAGVTGWFNDLNKFRTPGLRNLAARAPYNHNGVARTLRDVVNGYEGAGFQFNFTEAEKDDLVAFLETL